MKLCFESIEEVQEFVKRLKGTRGGKADKDDAETTGAVTTGAAPQPLMPPQGGQAMGFPGTGAAFQPPQQQPSFPSAGVDPVVAGLVDRINKRIDGAIQSGQPADTVLTWFRSQCGAEAANATMEQIKGVFLPKLTVPALEQIAKLMAA